jgi:hypothetical protein
MTSKNAIAATASASVSRSGTDSPRYPATKRSQYMIDTERYQQHNGTDW